jgi:hypothetical protein
MLTPKSKSKFNLGLAMELKKHQLASLNGVITKVTPPAHGSEPYSDIAKEGSSTPAERIREAAGQRKSTVSTYQTYFNLFSSVCRSQAIDPSSPKDNLCIITFGLSIG